MRGDLARVVPYRTWIGGCLVLMVSLAAADVARRQPQKEASRRQCARPKVRRRRPRRSSGGRRRVGAPSGRQCGRHAWPLRSARRGARRARRARWPSTSPASSPRTRAGERGASMVVSVTRGDTLFRRNRTALLKPASIMKMMTTALALDRLGAEHTFTTEVLADRGASGGVVDGNLYLRGGGDPTLSLRFWKGESPMDALARQVAGAGIKTVRATRRRRIRIRARADSRRLEEQLPDVGVRGACVGALAQREPRVDRRAGRRRQRRGGARSANDGASRSPAPSRRRRPRRTHGGTTERRRNRGERNDRRPVWRRAAIRSSFRSRRRSPRARWPRRSKAPASTSRARSAWVRRPMTRRASPRSVRCRSRASSPT